MPFAGFSGVNPGCLPTASKLSQSGATHGANFILLPIIIMYIYHALINVLSAHMIHINLNIIFYIHVLMQSIVLPEQFT